MYHIHGLGKCGLRCFPSNRLRDNWPLQIGLTTPLNSLPRSLAAKSSTTLELSVLGSRSGGGVFQQGPASAISRQHQHNCEASLRKEPPCHPPRRPLFHYRDCGGVVKCLSGFAILPRLPTLESLSILFRSLLPDCNHESWSRKGFLKFAWS